VQTPRWSFVELKAIPSAIIAAVIVLLSLSVVFLTLPGRPLILHSIQKLAHPSVFLVIAISVWLLIIKHLRSSPHTPVRSYLLSFLATVLLGALTELLQALVHRDPSWRDVGLDAKGALMGLMVILAFDYSWRWRFDREVRVTAGLIALGLLVLQLVPPLTTLAAYRHRAEIFPVLFEPRSDLDLLLVSTQGAPATLHGVDPELASPETEVALSVPLYVKPGSLSLDEPASHWLAYQSLCVELINPGHSAIELQLALRDRNTDKNSPPLSVPVHLDGRARSTPCWTIRQTPAWQSLDWDNIRQLTLTRVDGVGVEFLVKKIWLTPARSNPVSGSERPTVATPG